jgi:integrase
MLEDYQIRLSEKGLVGIATQPKRGRKFNMNKITTIRGKMKTVRQLFKFAVNRRLINRDTSAGYELPPKSRIEACCWSPSEVQAILRCATDYWRPRFQFLACTGLRADEMCWLTKDDVKIVDGKAFILIRKKTCSQSGRAWRPKHGKDRKVPLCAQAAEIVRVAMSESLGPWVFWSANTRGDQPGRTRPSVIWRALKKTMKVARIDRGTTHTFRHVFCSFAANNNIPAFQVMKILGHGSLDIVLIYYHADDDELHRAVNDVPFDNLLNSNEKEKN